MNRGGPLARVSKRRRQRLIDELGFMPSSTILPKTPRSPLGLRVSGGEGSAVPGHSPAAPKTTKKGSRALGGGLRNTHHTFLPEPAALIDERCGGWCEIALGDYCWGLATEYSHRVSQKAGGRHGEAVERSDRPSNAVKACHHCHHVITVTPWKVDAHANGWVLEEWQEPTEVKVLLRGEWVLLDDIGGTRKVKKAA